jgi:hypothetical protein
LTTQAVWKRRKNLNVRDSDPLRTFGGLRVDSSFAGDGPLKGANAVQLAIVSLFLRSMGTQAPASRIAFIVLLNPRIRSTRVRL